MTTTVESEKTTGVALAPIAPAAAYDELVAVFPLRPIRTHDDRRKAHAIVRGLIRVERNTDQDDYLAVLDLLGREYDAEHVALPSPTQGGVLRFLMDDSGTTQAELAAATGVPASNISEILADKRGISRANRAKFAEFFGVPAARFVIA